MSKLMESLTKNRSLISTAQKRPFLEQFRRTFLILNGLMFLGIVAVFLMVI